MLLAGLAARYVPRAQRASRVLLLGVPLVDVVLVGFVAVDLAAGAEPSRGHALAAVYLGVTVAFGHAIVRWADTRFAHRFADGPAPRTPPKGSREAVRAMWSEWLRLVLAVVIAGGLLPGMIALEGSGVPPSPPTPTGAPWR